MAFHRRIPCMVIALAAAPASAQVYSWATPASGLWSEPANWDLMSAPNSPTADVVVDLSGDYTVSLFGAIDVPTIPPTFMINSLSIDAPGAIVRVTCIQHPNTPKGDTGYRLTILDSLHVDGILEINHACYFETQAPLVTLQGPPDQPAMLTGSGFIRLVGGRLDAPESVLPDTIQVETSYRNCRVTFARIDATIRALSSPSVRDRLFINAGELNAPIELADRIDLVANIGSNNVPLTAVQGSSIDATIALNAADVVGAPDASLIIRECHNAPDVVIDAAGASLDLIGPITDGTIRGTPGVNARILGDVQATLEGEFTTGPTLPALRFTNNAIVSVPTDLQLNEPSDIDGVGEIRLLDNVTLTSNATTPSSIGAGQTITGEGRLRFFAPCSSGATSSPATTTTPPRSTSSAPGPSTPPPTSASMSSPRTTSTRSAPASSTAASHSTATSPSASTPISPRSLTSSASPSPRPTTPAPSTH